MQRSIPSEREGESVVGLVSAEDRAALERVQVLMAQVAELIVSHMGCCDIYEPDRLLLAQIIEDGCASLCDAYDAHDPSPSTPDIRNPRRMLVIARNPLLD